MADNAKIDGLTINNVTYDFTLSASSELTIKTLLVAQDTEQAIYLPNGVVRFSGSGDSQKEITLLFPATQTGSVIKTLATTDNGTLSVNGTAYTLDSATKPSIYVPTTGISTTNSIRYLLGSSSQTSIATTNTNATCYMQNGILYSSGNKCANIFTGTSTASSNNTTNSKNIRFGYNGGILYMWVGD